jgi:hypothetical protein
MNLVVKYRTWLLGVNCRSMQREKHMFQNRKGTYNNQRKQTQKRKDAEHDTQYCLWYFKLELSDDQSTIVCVDPCTLTITSSTSN